MRSNNPQVFPLPPWHDGRNVLGPGSGQWWPEKEKEWITQEGHNAKGDLGSLFFLLVGRAWGLVRCN